MDNEPAILDGMAALLGNWNCTVLKAQTCEEAIAVTIASDRAPDIILADYHLEHGTGLDVIAAVRARMAAITNSQAEVGDAGRDHHRRPHSGGRGSSPSGGRRPVAQAGETRRAAGLLARAAIRQRAAE